MFDAYQDRAVVEIDTNESVDDPVDIVLYDSFAPPESDHDDIGVLIENPGARHVVVYTWNFHPVLIDSALRKGAHGYLSKTLPARDLVTALEAVHAGDIVISEPPRRARAANGLDWPGRREGLSDREAEILALITQGRSNAEVAVLTFLSPTPSSPTFAWSTEKSTSRAAPRRSSGGSTTASPPTTAASSTSAATRDALSAGRICRRRRPAAQVELDQQWRRAAGQHCPATSYFGS
jgi:hypothetical protein